MEKAFDWVKRDYLLYKLLELNIDSNLYFCIKSLYSDNSAFIRINNEYQTEWFNVPSGVRQGDPLSPTLFNLFINDLVDYLKNTGVGIHIDQELISVLLYADDIILLAKSETELQILLGALETWCKTWLLKVNVSKTNIMHFRNVRKK